MNANIINKIIFDTIITITNTDEFSFTVDDEGDVIQFIFRDNIVINIEYTKEPTPWNYSEIVKYPSDIQVFQKYNPAMDEFDICYYHSSGIVDMDETTGDKLVIILGDGRTEKYRNIADFSRHTIPNFIADIIHQWIPKHIVYRNHKEDEKGCSKTTYFFNQIINVFEPRTVDKYLGGGVTTQVSSERMYKVYHNSGFSYTMNRYNYNVKEFKENDDGSKIFTIQTQMKMLEADLINKDRTAQENTYTFIPVGNYYICSEIYTKRKGIEISREYSIETDSDGIISLIKYYNGAVGTTITKVRKFTRKGNTIVLSNIFDEKELEKYI